MELNFSENFARLYEEEGGKKLVNSCSKSNLCKNVNKKFHLDCKYTRKKICTCPQNDLTLFNKDFSDFLTCLINDEVEIFENPENKNINFKRKDEVIKSFKESRSKIHLEKIKNFDFNKTKAFLTNIEENRLLSYNDYREVERSINDDKKICENCKTNIYENNYHKGWKNEAGDYVLLCPMCSKKYFNGALEIKFDRKDEMVVVNKMHPGSSNIMPTGPTYIKNESHSSFGSVGLSQPLNSKIFIK